MTEIDTFITEMIEGLGEDNEEKAIYELSRTLFDEKKLDMISALDEKQIQTVLRLFVFQELLVNKYQKATSESFGPDYKPEDVIPKLTDLYQKLTVSRDARGRNDILKSIGVLLERVERKFRFKKPDQGDL